MPVLPGLMVGLALMTGCVAFHSITPINPPVGNPNLNPARVVSLQPDLIWESSPDTAAIYDLIVYECLKEESFWKGVRRSVGDQVYYRDGIQGNTHKIEIVLKPYTEYYWSVRIRNGNKISEWSRYDYTLYLILSYMRINDSFFRFRTPGTK